MPASSLWRLPAHTTPHHTTLTPGLEVKVAFGGVWKESLSELSGGQKSLLALSLILAMLLFKPAPIYILDEVRPWGEGGGSKPWWRCIMRGCAGAVGWQKERGKECGSGGRPCISPCMRSAVEGARALLTRQHT